MSRSKKSRKPGGAPTAKPKLSKQELENVEKRIRKKKGKVAGNRQKEAAQQKSDKNQQSVNKDPRLGNKTPIVLGGTNKKSAKITKPKQSNPSSTPIAAVRFVESNEIDNVDNTLLSAEQALVAIEEDKELQTILAKQEDDIALTEQEVDYYNDMMERHQALSAQLGLDNEDEDSEEIADEGDEEALWDKLDNNDFSAFEEKE